MSVQSTETETPEIVTPESGTPESDSVEYAGGSALKPLLYILVLPLVVIALLQWSHLPALLVDTIIGH